MRMCDVCKKNEGDEYAICFWAYDDEGEANYLIDEELDLCTNCRNAALKILRVAIKTIRKNL